MYLLKRLNVNNECLCKLCLKLVLLVVTRKSYNDALAKQPHSCKCDGQQMCSRLCEEDILMKTWCSCQTFTETQQQVDCR